MLLTQKLISYLNRVFDKDPHSFLALRLRYSGTSMTWIISDNVLKTTVVGGVGSSLSVDLTAHTIASLAAYLSGQPGYSVAYADSTELSLLSAKVLIDGSGDQDASNGDHIPAYTSLLWAYLEAFANELKSVSYQIDQALIQMNMRKAEAFWLDEWGGYYGISRKTGETDSAYSNRIIIEVLRPRGNNIAIEMALRELLGQPVTVSDVTIYGSAVPKFNGGNTYNGAIQFNTAAESLYGLFDIDYYYNLESGVDMTGYETLIREYVEMLRDAGTFLRGLNLKASQLSDTISNIGTDYATLTVFTGSYFNGGSSYSGAIKYAGPTDVSEILS